MNDKEIISLFFKRDEKAIDALSEKYGRMMRKISYNILHDDRDADECVNDALLGVWNRIPPENPDPLVTFVCRIVKNVSVARYRYNTAEKRNSTYDVCIDELAECLPAKGGISCEADELTSLIEKFLDSQTRTNRIIFMKRYWYDEPIKVISQETGIKESSVNVRLFRLRKKLRAFIEKEGMTI